MNKHEFVKKRAEFRDRTIEEMIELLASGDLETRFFAEMCLRDATST